AGDTGDRDGPAITVRPGWGRSSCILPPATVFWLGSFPGSPYATSIYQADRHRVHPRPRICRNAVEHAARGHRLLQEHRRGRRERAAVAGEAAPVARLRRAELDLREERHARVSLQGTEQPRPSS